MWSCCFWSCSHPQQFNVVRQSILSNSFGNFWTCVHPHLVLSSTYLVYVYSWVGHIDQLKLFGGSINSHVLSMDMVVPQWWNKFTHHRARTPQKDVNTHSLFPQALCTPLSHPKKKSLILHNLPFAITIDSPRALPRLCTHLGTPTTDFRHKQLGGIKSTGHKIMQHP